MKLPNAFPASPLPPSVPSQDSSFEEIILDIKDTKATQKKSFFENGNLLEVFRFLNDWFVEQGTVPLKDKLVFFQLLGATIHAGISITDALLMIAEQTKKLKLKKTIHNIYDLIHDGESLAGAMKRNDDIFDSTSCAIIEAGEKSGKLNYVLTELVSQYEQLDKIQKRVKGVLTYPTIVIIMIFILAAVVLIFIVPKLLKIFGNVESLPIATRILKGASDLVLGNWPFLLLFLVFFIISFFYWKKSFVGKRQWAGFLLSLPLISDILKGLIISRFTRVFGFLLSSGVPMIEGLRLAASTTNNPLYEEKLLLASDDLTKGISIAENIADNEKLFPKMLINMIAVGEKSASLEGVMGKIADYYQEELNRQIDGLSRLLEPVILMFIASVAVFFILAVYMPILQMNEQFLK